MERAHIKLHNNICGARPAVKLFVELQTSQQIAEQTAKARGNHVTRFLDWARAHHSLGPAEAIVSTNLPADYIRHLLSVRFANTTIGHNAGSIVSFIKDVLVQSDLRAELRLKSRRAREDLNAALQIWSELRRK